MGMYCDVYGKSVKMRGLLAEVVLLAASQGWIHTVQLEEVEGSFYLSNVVELERVDVQDVILPIMRDKLLGGWGSKACRWSRGLGEGEKALINLQDIYGFESDVATFSILATWLRWGTEERLVWA